MPSLMLSPATAVPAGLSDSGFFDDVEAVFVPANPPRQSHLALWRPDGAPPAGAEDTIDLVVPVGDTVLRQPVPVRLVPVADVLDQLLAIPGDALLGPSVLAWARVARIAVELVARGRLSPGLTEDGLDGWRLGPLDPDDVRRRVALAAALPPQAHCLAVDSQTTDRDATDSDAVPTDAVDVTNTDPANRLERLRMSSPRAAVDAFSDAVADIVPRSAAAVRFAGHRAFADLEPQPVGHAADWFAATASGGARTAVTLRLVLPSGDPDDPDDPTGLDGAPFEGELILQSPDDPSLMVPVAELWESPDAVMARFDDAEDVLLLTLRRAARVWPPIARLLGETRPSRLVLDDDEVDDLLGPVVDGLADAGLYVDWPSQLLSPLDVRPTISTPQVGAIAGSGLSLDVILGWKASVDGLDLTERELEELAAAKRGVVQLRGRWITADPNALRRLGQSSELSAGEAIGVALGGALIVDGEVTEAEVIGPLADLGSRLRTIDLERDQPEPEHLDAELRPYQRRGLAWMVEMADLGLGGVLADDMGLGKTIQMLALHLHRLNRSDNGVTTEPAKPTLVVCPATLVANWERETARFTPTVPVRRYHGPNRSLDDLEPGALVITTYGVVRRDRDVLASVEWGLVAADEAQAIKNPLSRTARAMRQIGADARFALTGTPVENQLTELWAICDWTTPQLLGPMERFRREIATPIERDHDPEVTQWLATLIRPFVIRRRKSDPGIAPDLPPKTETDQIVSLTAEQTTLYKAVVDESLERIEHADGIQRRGLVLKLLTALKQICNHPAHYLGQTGPLSSRSNKLEALTDLLGIIGQEDASALVFTQYVTMGHLLDQHLREQGIRVSFLHGSLSLRARQDLVDGFQAGEADVFLLSLKAGGTGLNLTKASHVIHYDRWWNPAVEDQASDRVWRIGQDKPVQVHRLICEGTIEDRIAQVLASKRDLADQVVGGGEAWVSELSDADLAALVDLSSGQDR